MPINYLPPYPYRGNKKDKDAWWERLRSVYKYMTRKQLTQVLQMIDPNGSWLDVDSRRETGGVVSKKDALGAVKDFCAEALGS